MSLRTLIAVGLLFITGTAYAARGFDTTFGAGVTDSIQGGYASTPTGAATYSLWFWLNGGAGGGGFGRLWNQDTTNSTVTGVDSFETNGTTNLEFARGWSSSSGGTGVWSIPYPSTGAWHHLMITYNASSTSNAPTIYLDCSSQTVTQATAPSGTLVTGSGNYYLGNRSFDGARVFDGKLAEFAVWNGSTLTANEDGALCHGASPLKVHGGPSFYLPLFATTSGEPDWGPSHLAQTITGTKFQPHAPAQNCYPQGSCGQ